MVLRFVNASVEAAVGRIGTAQPQPKPRPFSRRWTIGLVACDLATLGVAAFCGVAISENLRPHAVVVPSYITACAIVVMQLVFFWRLDLYRRTFSSHTRDEVYSTAAALTIGALPMLVFFTIWPGLSTSRLTILATLAVSVPLVCGVRAFLYDVRFLAMQSQPRRIAIVGQGARLDVAARSLALVHNANLLKMPIDDLDASVEAMRVGGTSDPSLVPWFASALRWHCDTLVLTESLPPWSLPILLAVAAEANVKLAFAPPRFRVHAYGMSVEVDGEQTLIVPTQLRACTRGARALKRIVDVAFASAALVAIAPLLALCALAIVLESGAPVFYSQPRVGLGGRVFAVYKLRSMRRDAEARSGPVWAARGDARVTRVGRLLRRLSLDELPQFVNVLRGEMSIVGPRPERPEFVARFRESIERYDERHLVRPGITGWSQINLRRTLRPNEAGTKLSYDLFYIEQWSLFLDAYIVVKTGFEFLFHQAA